MSPMDPAVVTAGGEQLSPGDAAKLRAAYQCGHCGGYQTGRSGRLAGAAATDTTCEWLIQVKRTPPKN